MLRKIKRFMLFLKLNYTAHHSQLDVVRFEDEKAHSFKAFRKCYMFSLVWYTFTNLYGILGLECESRPSCKIDRQTLLSSPYSAWHQQFPHVVWHQINLLVCSVVVFCISCWIGLLFTPPIGKRYLIYPHLKHEKNDDKKDQLIRMLTFRGRFVKLASLTEIMIVTTGVTFFYANVLFVNSVYNVNLTSAVFWLLLNPVQNYFNGLLVCTLPFYAILASRYITIQQQTLINKMKVINSKMNKIQDSVSSMSRIKRGSLWLQYIEVNIQMCKVCRNLEEYSRFWSPYLTRLLLSLISMQCYGFYMFLFVPNLPFILRLMLFWIVLILVLNEVMLIILCGAVVKNSQRFAAQNREFFQLYRSRPAVGQIWPRNLAKAENLQDSRLFHSYAFRWVCNNRITTKSFNMIITYIVLFFLFITKNKKKHEY